jgi:hypothetical protein
MLLKLTSHFQLRMVERGINLDHVKRAIKDPDSVEDAFDEKLKATKEVDGKIIQVIYYKEGFKSKEITYIVIIAYYLI